MSPVNRRSEPDSGMTPDEARAHDATDPEVKHFGRNHPPQNGDERAAAPPARRPKRAAPDVQSRPRSPIEMLPPEQQPLPLNDQSDEPSPLERSGRSAYVKISRVTANGPQNGYEEGDDYIGPLGKIPHRDDFEIQVRRRWGGGDYEVSGLVDGKVKTVSLQIGGPSKPAEIDEDDTWDGPPIGHGPTATSGIGYARPAFVAPGMPPSYAQPFPGTPGFFPPPFPPPFNPYGGMPPGYANPQAMAYHNMGQRQVAGAEDAEKLALREELEEAKAAARSAKEEATRAEFKRDMDRRDAEHKAEMARLEGRLRDKDDGGTGGMKEMIQQQQSQWQQRIEEERLDRERKRDEDETRRREERDRLETERREERDKRDRDETSRREREDREERRRQEEYTREREERRADAARQDRREERMMTMMTSNQVKPSDMVSLMGGLKQLGGDNNAGKQLREMVETVAELKDLANDGPAADDPAEKAQRFVAGVTNAAQPMLSEVGKWFAGNPPQQPQQPQQPQWQSQPPPPQVLPPGAVMDAQGRIWIPRSAPQAPGAPPPVQVGTAPIQPPPQPQPQAPQGGPPTPTQAGNQVAQEAQLRGVTPQQWGKILEFTVDNVMQQTAADASAEHLLTLLKAIDARPALEQLASTRLADLRMKVNLLLISNKVTDPVHLDRMKKFVELADPRGPAAKWFGDFLKHLQDYWEQLKAYRAKEAAAARAAQGVSAPVAPPVPPIVEPADGIPLAPAEEPEGEEDDLPPEVPEHGEGS